MMSLNHLAYAVCGCIISLSTFSTFMKCCTIQENNEIANNLMIFSTFIFTSNMFNFSTLSHLKHIFLSFIVYLTYIILTVTWFCSNDFFRGEWKSKSIDIFKTSRIFQIILCCGANQVEISNVRIQNGKTFSLALSPLTIFTLQWCWEFCLIFPKFSLTFTTFKWNNNIKVTCYWL